MERKPSWRSVVVETQAGREVQDFSWHLWVHAQAAVPLMMMIAFITIKSSLVPLIEGQCAQIYLRSEISVVLLTSSSFLFCERKNVLKENKQAVSPDFYL